MEPTSKVIAASVKLAESHNTVVSPPNMVLVREKTSEVSKLLDVVDNKAETPALTADTDPPVIMSVNKIAALEADKTRETLAIEEVDFVPCLTEHLPG